MCLGVPTKIEHIDGGTARCSAGGVERDVSLFPLRDENLAPGDYVMILGYAIQKLSETEALSR